MTQKASILISSEPLKPYLDAVELAEKKWEAVGAAYDAAPAGEKGSYAERFQDAERAYNSACVQLARCVASEVDEARSAELKSSVALVRPDPKIYSAKLTQGQNAALARYEAICGLEPVDLEAFDTGQITAYELWQNNLFLLESVLGDVQKTHFPVPLEESMAAWAKDE